MWNDRRERKLPSAILRRRLANPSTSNPNSKTTTTTTNRVRVKPQLAGQRPTFTGAQDWVERHRGDIGTVVQLLDLYPNIIQIEGLDPLPCDFLQPVFLDKGLTIASKTENRKEEARTRKKNKGKSHHAPHHKTRSSRRSHTDGPSARYVYVCDTVTSTVYPPSDKSTQERISTALSSYCYVRTNPELPASETDLADVLSAVSTADAFLFLMNDGSLSSWFCLHQLGIAIAYDIPIIAVREAGYNLSSTLPPEFDRFEIVKTSADAVTTPSVSRQQHVRSKSSDTWHETRTKSESQSSGFHSDSENVIRQPSKRATSSLSDVIRNCFHTSVLYVPNFHDSCIAKLFGRLSDYFGDIFLDAEISKTEKYQRGRGSQSTDSEASGRLPDIKGSSVFRTLPSHHSANEKHTEGTPSSEGSHDPPDTPSSTDKSSITPTSPLVRLPPINIVHTSEETPTPGELSPDDIKTSMKSAPNYMNLFITPPSSPFLQTRYLVFPGDPKGSAKKPYLVTFPADVYGKVSPEEDEEGRDLERDDNNDDNDNESEDLEIRRLQIDDEPSFDKIKLNVRQDAINEKSPFSTPLPSARKPHVSKPNTATETPRKEGKPGDRPPKAAERCERFRTKNGKIRDIQLAERSKQTQITQPAKKYLRNNSSSGWMTAAGPFDKKNIKMTKVTLQYGPKGKLPNPLI